MLEETVDRLGNDIADLAYRYSLLEEEIAKLNAYITEIKEKEREDA
jgi:hypothetical protein|tara:strand:+ start:268 stop:405 length:138 start_codon:yes stop_codon:yes gene_type:complete